MPTDLTHPRSTAALLGGYVVTVILWATGLHPPVEVTGALVGLAGYLCSGLAGYLCSSDSGSVGVSTDNPSPDGPIPPTVHEVPPLEFKGEEERYTEDGTG